MSGKKDLQSRLYELEQIKKVKEGLPHLYCFPFYKWQREFWEQTSPFQINYAANQIGKSSIMIRKMIRYCTDKSLWKQFKKKPTIAFYLYPDRDTITREVKSKWTEFLPCNGYENDPVYGYKIKYEGKYASHIEWNSGVTLYFKSYGLSNVKETAHRLQASTPFIVAADEVLPIELWPELQMRIASPANKGAMFWMNATPTRPVAYWADVQAGRVIIPNSWVNTTSMYDCLTYECGSKSIWTIKKIKEIEQTLPDQMSIDIRVHGLFKAVDGLALSSFDKEHNLTEGHPLKGGRYQCGIDYGIGGSEGGHPSSIVIVWINDDNTQARIVRSWVGVGQRTTVDDVLNKYIEMANSLGLNQIETTYYDWACAEMQEIGNRRGLTLIKADKSRDKGFATLNSLFKNSMLKIYKKDNESWERLVYEIENLRADAKKSSAEDDGIDALRYAISNIIFNFENITVKEDGTPKKPTTPKLIKRRGEKIDYDDFEENDLTYEEEIDEWNDYVEGYY